MNVKRCRTCLQDKNVTEFHVKDNKTGRLFPDCKICHNNKKKNEYYTDGGKIKERVRKNKAQRYAENPDEERAKVQAWRKANPEAAKAITRRSDAKRAANGKRAAYREANKDRIRETNALYRDANRDLLREKAADYRRANREILALRQRLWREANPGACKAIAARWKAANTEVVNANTHRRRARLRGCTEHHTAAEWEALKAACHYTCLCCGRQEPEIALTKDHVIPLADTANTSNAIWNIQPLCKSCNSAKWASARDYRAGGAEPMGAEYVVPRGKRAAGDGGEDGAA